MKMKRKGLVQSLMRLMWGWSLRKFYTGTMMQTLILLMLSYGAACRGLSQPLTEGSLQVTSNDNTDPKCEPHSAGCKAMQAHRKFRFTGQKLSDEAPLECDHLAIDSAHALMYSHLMK